MGRPIEVRSELLNTGILKNSADEEVARLSENGILVINELELFFSIVRGANKYGGRCPCTQLYKVYGLTGGWKKDPNVVMALNHLQELDVIKIYTDPISGNPKTVEPLMVAAKAIKVIPPYHSRKEVLAGLYPIDVEEV